MSKLSIQTMPLVLAGVLGVLTAVLFVPLVGLSSAIAAPLGLFRWPMAHGLLEPALFAWHMIVVAGIALAIPMLASMLMLGLVFPTQRLAVLASFVISVFVGRYVILPLLYLEPVIPAHHVRWSSFSDEAAMAVVVAAMLILFRRRT